MFSAGQNISLNAEITSRCQQAILPGKSALLCYLFITAMLIVVQIVWKRDVYGAKVVFWNA